MPDIPKQDIRNPSRQQDSLTARHVDSSPVLHLTTHSVLRTPHSVLLPVRLISCPVGLDPLSASGSDLRPPIPGHDPTQFLFGIVKYARPLARLHACTPARLHACLLAYTLACLLACFKTASLTPDQPSHKATDTFLF